MAKAVLTLTSKNYSSWSLRGWLLAKFAGLDFTEKMIAPGRPRGARRDPAAVLVDPGAAPRARRRARLGRRWRSPNT